MERVYRHEIKMSATRLIEKRQEYAKNKVAVAVVIK
jgi:hypothetical protein